MKVIVFQTFCMNVCKNYKKEDVKYEKVQEWSRAVVAGIM